MIDRTLAGFLEEGVGVHIATRNNEFLPNGARALAVKVDDDGTHLVVFVSTVAAERLLPDLRANGQVAVGFGRPIDERACQVKGVFVSARTALARERPIVNRQWEGFLTQLNAIGIPREPLVRWPTWPATAIRLKATALFEQTPGPGAGAPMP
jgi:hypothetical protein